MQLSALSSGPRSADPQPAPPRCSRSVTNVSVCHGRSSSRSSSSSSAAGGAFSIETRTLESQSHLNCTQDQGVGQDIRLCPLSAVAVAAALDPKCPSCLIWAGSSAKSDRVGGAK